MYTEANHGLILLLFTGMKWALLVSLSTTTQIPVLPFLYLGNPSTKSIETLSHFHCGTSNGCSNPPGFFCSAFTCWHTKHLATYSATSLFTPAQSKLVSCPCTSCPCRDEWSSSNDGHHQEWSSSDSRPMVHKVYRPYATNPYHLGYT